MNAPSHTPLSVLKSSDGQASRKEDRDRDIRTYPGHRHAHRPDSEARQGPGRPPRSILLIAQLMVILDITAVNIAMPSLANDLQLSGSSISWTITSYSLIFGSLLLFGGRAADLLGRRRMFLTGLGCLHRSRRSRRRLAGSAAALFAARAGQGLGAAMLSPAALAIIMTAFQGNQRAKALAAWGAVGGAGAAIGVLVGGVLTEFGDWRMIFYVNLPVAVALAIAAVKIVPADTQKPRWRGLDLRGAVLATTSLGAIVFAITQADERRLDVAPDAARRSRRRRGARRVRRLRAPHRYTAPAHRAAGGSCRRRRPLPDARCRRFDLRPLPAQLALPAERPRHGAARDRPRLHPARRWRRESARTRPVTSSAATACAAPLTAAFVVAAGGMALLAHVGENGSYLRDVLPGMLVAGLGLGVAVVSRLDRDPHRRPRGGDRHDLGPQLHRPRDRRHDRDRDLLDDRGRHRRPRRAAGRLRDLPRVRRSRAPRRLSPAWSR